MRVLLAFGLVALLAVPAATAEFGPLGADGWPIAVDGTSTNAFPGITAEELDARLAALAATTRPGANAPPLNVVGGATVFPYYPVLLAEVNRLATEFPDLVRLHSIGKSVLGLDLWMLEVCDFGSDDPEASCGPDPLGQERKVVWVDGGTHSNEYSGAYFTLAWAQYLVEAYGTDANATWIVENRHTWMLPLVNPDGSNAMGRLNAHGVNINRNYPVVWDGEGHDATLNNRGPSPASEPETQANIAWFNRTLPDYYASIHCCGNLWLYPYGEEGVDPLDQAMLQRVCDEAFATVREDCGPIWSTIYPASGSSVDTVYEHTGAVAFGYEMSGRGAVSIWGQPVTFEDVRTQEVESWQGLLHAFLNVHRYGANPVVTAARAAGDGVLVSILNEGLGNATGTLRLAGGEAVAFQVTAGNSTEVLVPGDDVHGALAVAYQERLASRTATVDLVELVAPGAEATAGSVVVEKAGSDAAVPGPGVIVLVALAGFLAILRRRRA